MWSAWVKGIGKGAGRMMPHDRSGLWIADRREYCAGVECKHKTFIEQYKDDAQKYFGELFELRVEQTQKTFKVQFRRIGKHA